MLGNNNIVILLMYKDNNYFLINYIFSLIKKGEEIQLWNLFVICIILFTVKSRLLFLFVKNIFSIHYIFFLAADFSVVEKLCWKLRIMIPLDYCTYMFSAQL